MITHIIGIVIGIIIGMMVAMRSIEVAITKADLCHNDKRMIRDVLGIQQEGERK